MQITSPRYASAVKGFDVWEVSVIDNMNGRLLKMDEVEDAVSETSTYRRSDVFSREENDTRLMGEECSGDDCVNWRSP